MDFNFVKFGGFPVRVPRELPDLGAEHFLNFRGGRGVWPRIFDEKENFRNRGPPFFLAADPQEHREGGFLSILT